MYLFNDKKIDGSIFYMVNIIPADVLAANAGMILTYIALVPALEGLNPCQAKNSHTAKWTHRTKCISYKNHITKATKYQKSRNNRAAKLEKEFFLILIFQFPYFCISLQNRMQSTKQRWRLILPALAAGQLNSGEGLYYPPSLLVSFI